VQTTVLVADFSGTLVGVIAIEKKNGPEISHLWVAPECHRLGLGRQLVEHAFALARECGWAAYRVESDPFAVPFYESMGAVKVGEVAAPVLGVERFLPVLRLPVPQTEL